MKNDKQSFRQVLMELANFDDPSKECYLLLIREVKNEFKKMTRARDGDTLLQAFANMDHLRIQAEIFQGVEFDFLKRPHSSISKMIVKVGRDYDSCFSVDNLRKRSQFKSIPRSRLALLLDQMSRAKRPKIIRIGRAE